MFLHLDCRHYRGDRPCEFQRGCEGCPHYHPMGPRVLIIKLGALGDVVRTSALLPGLTRLTTDQPYVTWVTSPAALELVRRMPGVHRALPFDTETILRMQVERFDWVISLDKEPGPCALAMTVRAGDRRGVGLSRYGTPFPLSDHADTYFELGLNNDEKFRVNQRSYQDLMYEAIGLEYEGEAYSLEPTEADRARALERFASFGAPPGTRWIGLNPGAGGVFANKAWPVEKYVELIALVAERRPGARFMLLGGRPEAPTLDAIAAGAAERVGPGRVHHGGVDNPLGDFLALIECCDLLVTGDTLAMHLGIARARRVVALFGPTCAQEIDLFGRGEKIITSIECSPCYLRSCDKSPHCQDMIPAERVALAALEQLALEEESLIQVGS